MNVGDMFKLKSAKDRFERNHPKFFPFVKAAFSRGMCEDTVIDIVVTMPDGEKLASNLKIKKDDIELFNELKNISGM